uniref:C2H2-type domain-containing protein n=1 Tax=Manihot esculenta TaxID=3983 RepID=A0A2C9UBM4_MANES
MPGLTCNACNKEFQDDAEQKLHYKQSALTLEKNKSSETPMLYSCVICGKGYQSPKAHAQHLKSWSHIMHASQGTNQDEDKAVIKPLSLRGINKHPPQREVDNQLSEGSDEWEEVDPEEELIAEASDEDMDESEGDDLLNPSCCFMCDQEHDNLESCMVHMHKQHGFFIPDVEYLKDPNGLLTYLSLKMPSFNSLEAVRKHMVAKSHCRVHYGDGDDDDEEAELEEFYDYSSSYVDEDGKQLITSGDVADTVELGNGGSELIVTTRSDNKISSKTLGCREFLRYYRQKPRPSAANDGTIAAALASRYRGMGLATVQTKEQMVRMKVMKEMNRSGIEAMRTKIGLKNNVIRNLPKKVPY